MTGRFFGSHVRLRWLAASALTFIIPASVSAQQEPPPPPLPPPMGEEDAEEETDAPDQPDVPSAQGSGDSLGPTSAPIASPEAPPTAAATSSGAVAGGAAAATGATAATAVEPRTAEPWEQPVEEPGAEETGAEDYKKWRREVSTRRQTTINGSTGVHRVREAGSGAAGTFRINLLTSYYSGKGFLCTAEAPCTDNQGNDLGEDKARRTTGAAVISVTPFPFLEAFLTIQNSATYNDNGTPSSLLVMGDTNFGLKGFMPDKADRIFAFGGEADLYLLTGTSGVSAAGGATSFAMRGLGTLDLNNRTNPHKRIPFRAHANLGYFFDNSSKIVEGLETTPPPDGRGAPIQRTERYGLGISRVDSLEIGLAAEYINPYVRPFLEWTVDVPVNRQKYVCNRQGAASRGDECLGDAAGLGTSPNRFSLGANVFPWQASGLSVKLALDIGTGGKKRFLEETTPETPYALWFGLGYVVDTVPPKPEKIEVEAPVAAPEPRRYVLGLIVDSETGEPVTGALVHYKDVPMTGLVASPQGEFISQDLPPGSYDFTITAEDHEEGTCSVVIPETAAPLPTETAGAEASSVAPSESGETTEPPADTAANLPQEPYTDADGNTMVPVVCKLKELPQIANITGLLVDSDTGGPVADATVTIVDKLNRTLKLEVDDAGSFQFRNVPFGTARLQATAPGYLPTVAPVRINSRKDQNPNLVMNARPSRLGVRIQGGELKIDRPLKFVAESSELTIKSTAMLEEIAVFLMDNPDAGNIEIQVHTDDSGAASYSRRLSQQRADHLMDLLNQLGVKANRLTAKGYGPDQPLVPNINDANRDKNNRVQMVVVKDEQ